MRPFLCKLQQAIIEKRYPPSMRDLFGIILFIRRYNQANEEVIYVSFVGTSPKYWKFSFSKCYQIPNWLIMLCMLHALSLLLRPRSPSRSSSGHYCALHSIVLFV